jgi:site-specific DNA-methyltransferase (adenine-specific)
MRYNGSMDTDNIITGDCLDALTTMPADVVDLAFAGPPFDIGLKYPVYNDSGPPREYLAWLEERFRALRRMLAPAGSLVEAIGTAYLAEEQASAATERKAASGRPGALKRGGKYK